MKKITIFLIFTALTLSSCMSKEEKCEQIVFSMAQNGLISMNKYRSGSIQKQCIIHYNDRGYGKWRSCMESSYDSPEDMKQCKTPAFISAAILNKNF